MSMTPADELVELQWRLRQLQQQLRGPTHEEAAALKAAEVRADAALALHGEKAGSAALGETPLDYRRRMLRRAAQFSPRYQRSDLSGISGGVLQEMERQVYNDVTNAALAVWSHDVNAAPQCSQGFQPRGDACVSQRMADFIACVEAVGGNKQDVDDFLTSTIKEETKGGAAGEGKGVIVSGTGSLALDKHTEEEVAKRLQTKFFSGGTSECRMVLGEQTDRKATYAANGRRDDLRSIQTYIHEKSLPRGATGIITSNPFARRCKPPPPRECDDFYYRAKTSSLIVKQRCGYEAEWQRSDISFDDQTIRITTSDDYVSWCPSKRAVNEAPPSSSASSIPPPPPVFSSDNGNGPDTISYETVCSARLDELDELIKLKLEDPADNGFPAKNVELSIRCLTGSCVSCRAGKNPMPLGSSLDRDLLVVYLGGTPFTEDIATLLRSMARVITQGSDAQFCSTYKEFC